MACIGQVPAKINGVIDVTIKNLNVSEETPTNVHKGALGVIGTAQGIPDVKTPFTVAVLTSGPIINYKSISAGDGFSLTFSLGVKRYAITGCHMSSRGLKVDNGAGNVTIDYGVTGETWKDL